MPGDPEQNSMTVLEVDREHSLALCRDDESEAQSMVETTLVDPVHPGDQLLVYAGTAIFRLAGAD